MNGGAALVAEVLHEALPGPVISWKVCIEFSIAIGACATRCPLCMHQLSENGRAGQFGLSVREARRRLVRFAV
jgi:hypothetical protein